MIDIVLILWDAWRVMNDSTNEHKANMQSEIKPFTGSYIPPGYLQSGLSMAEWTAQATLRADLKWLARVLPDWSFKIESEFIACYPPGPRNAANFAALAVHAVIEQDFNGAWLVSGLVPQVHVLDA